MWQKERFWTCKTSMLNLSWNRPLMLSLHLNCFQSRRKKILIRSSVLWMSTEMVSFPRKRSRMAIVNTSVKVLPTNKLIKCLLKSMPMEVVKSITQNLLWPQWTKRISWATTSFTLPSKCSIRMVVVPSRQMKLSRFFPSDKTWMSKLSIKSSNKSMRTVTVKSLTKSLLPWCWRTLNPDIYKYERSKGIMVNSASLVAVRLFIKS